jgi:hypothetical protein
MQGDFGYPVKKIEFFGRVCSIFEQVTLARRHIPQFQEGVDLEANADRRPEIFWSQTSGIQTF